MDECGLQDLIIKTDQESSCVQLPTVAQETAQHRCSTHAKRVRRIAGCLRSCPSSSRSSAQNVVARNQRWDAVGTSHLLQPRHTGQTAFHEVTGMRFNHDIVKTVLWKHEGQKMDKLSDRCDIGLWIGKLGRIDEHAMLTLEGVQRCRGLRRRPEFEQLVSCPQCNPGKGSHSDACRKRMGETHGPEPGRSELASSPSISSAAASSSTALHPRSDDGTRWLARNLRILLLPCRGTHRGLMASASGVVFVASHLLITKETKTTASDRAPRCFDES